MKKKRFLIGLLVALALVLCTGLYLSHTYIIVGQQACRRDIETLTLAGRDVSDWEKLLEMENLQSLDLRNTGLTAEQYETLHTALPDCEILWSPEFQADFYDWSTTSITIQTLTEADIEALDYFTALETVEAEGCRDYAQLTALRNRRPELEVHYSIALSSGDFSWDAEEITVQSLTDADVENLQYFPNLTAVNAAECRDYPQIAALRQSYPEVAIDYVVTLSGESYAWDTSEITLEAADPAEIMEMLQYLPCLTRLTLNETAEEDTDGLLDACVAYPEVEINWDFTLYGVAVNSQDTQVDLSGIAIDDLDTVESVTSRMPQMQKVIMSDCGIDNETMDALNRRHEDIQYVWTVVIGRIHRLRTDETYYIPVKRGDVTFYDGQLDNLRYCTELVALDLGHHCITNIDFIQYMPHLRYLIIADTEVSDISPLANLTELVYLEMFLTEVTDYSPLLGCTALEDLNLCYTRGDPEIIAQMTWLKRVWWINPSSWRCTAEEQAMLAEALPDCTFVYDGISSTGGGWRTGYLYYEMRDYFGMYYMTG